jgi:hypothetical protein
MTGMQGSIAADVGRTEMILRNAEIPGTIPYFLKIILKIIQLKLSKMYINKYCKINNIKREEIDIWKIPLYVARLNEENCKNEEKRILKYIRRNIKKQTCA